MSNKILFDMFWWQKCCYLSFYD